MKHALQLRPMVLAVSGALGLMAAAGHAQTFDPNGAAVRQAYLGAATQEKKDAALAGLKLLRNQVLQSAGSTITLPSLGSHFSITTTGSGSDVNAVDRLILPGPIVTAQPLNPNATLIQAANDNALGAPGAPVTLDNAVLQTLASFNTARNFTIGTNGATIDTNGFNFGISGTVNSIGTLTKEGLGTLALTGNNSWGFRINVNKGVLEGSVSSIGASVIEVNNNATVRFNQTTDEVYSGRIVTSALSPITSGILEKSGPGKLTISSPELHRGATNILGGTLALQGFGSLSSLSPLNVNAGGTLDISGSLASGHVVGQLSGAGNITLGRNLLLTQSNTDSTFSGSIAGSGGLAKDGTGVLTLTGVNTYTGITQISNGTLAIAGQGKLNPAGSVVVGKSGFDGSLGIFDISGATGPQEIGSIGGEGNVRLGANTLIVGGSSTNNFINGVLSGTITGSGGLTKTGIGGLQLTGANSYTGVTAINQGVLIARAQSISDRVVNHASLTITADAGDETYSGAISGSGDVTKTGSGSVTLTGVSSYTGPTTILGGTLALAGQGRLNATSGITIRDPSGVPSSSGRFDISRSASNQEVGFVEGYGSIQLGANTLTVGRTGTSHVYNGIITGSGGLTKTGSGSLALKGENAYTGVTRIERGGIIARTNSISDRVVNDGTLTFFEDKGATAPFISAYSGNISGTGQLVKEGDGIIWLRGLNTYAGGTTVNSGYLIGNTDSLQGNITNNAALAFYQVDNGTYSGTLSGSGALLHFGPGVLTLTGNNTYTGGTATSGTIRIDRDANLGAANGPLVLAGGTLQLGANVVTDRAILFAEGGGTIDTNGYNLSTGTRLPPGALNSTGGLTKIGAGTLTFNRIEANASTAVQGGRLEVNNWYVSNVTVGAGAELGGSGAIVGKVVNNGRLTFGNAIGQMNVVGDVNFEPGSVFTVKANAAGNSDRLVLPDPTLVGFPIGSGASARAILKGGSVDVRAESGTYNRQTRYNIINAEGGISGQFQGVTSNFAFLNPSLAYDTNNVYLTLTRNDLDYATVAQTTNQAAVARGLTRMTGAATGDAATVTAVLDGLSAPQARAAFDSIGAAGRGALPQVGTLNQRSVNQNLVARLGIAEGGSTLAPVAGIGGRAVQLAFDESSRSDAAPVYAQVGLPAGGQGLRDAGNEPNNGLWLRSYGGTGRIDGDASAPGAKYHYGGTLFGYDRKLGDHLRLGAFGGYAEPRYDQDVATSSARTKTYQFGGYGRLHSGAWHVDAVASYARNDTNTSRTVTVGALNRAASGSFKGDTVSLHAESGYTIKLNSFELQPLAALSWVRQTQNAYGETGAGALNLVLPEQSQQSLRSSLGLRTLHPFQAGATQAMFETRAAWSHEFKDTRSINARLAGDPAAAVFTVSGPTLPRDSAVVGVGIAAQASRSLRLYADLNGEFNGRVRAGALSLGLRYQW